MFRPFSWVIFRRKRILVLVPETNVDTVVSILSFSELFLCILSRYIFSYDTQQDAYYKGFKKLHTFKSRNYQISFEHAVA
jgi:hypothetical protein